ncbi:hypothetical protein TBLA_0G02580 [Henningerozyma blattae CBS 6284]|uniref:Uncharacterized protein n=1 Tax=Henningerozyma blattae (strain ATCC 34711 / CBS 6284 / DSM 70876 / NBRC 10599 / NRRL Y-10934 / UCD 77-7) TaxID=1071380 RepID=I2H744_HENB6|nr:hypothetical protein TBLA_0G02580 [Tetrapisispora blattae CBS 6284]CCH62196.1 hypothetical protein TBLA_0G02580 [Tetrapisispora blattae CBS 6284]
MDSSTSAPRKVALVTGASSGIGFAVTKELALKGYKVYACARRTEPMIPLEKEFGHDIVVRVNLDITNIKEVMKFKERLNDELVDKKLDVLYNNAGQSCTLPALDVTMEQVEQCFRVNFFGHVNLCRELSEFVINAKGTILFTGSVSGIFIFPFGSIYAASKAAIHQYARVLHLELKPFGVRVINVVTGGVDTNIADTRQLPADSIYNFPEGQAALENRQLMAKNNRPMSAEEYARQVVQDIASAKDPVDVYRGKMATVLYFVSVLVPYWLIEMFVVHKFKLGAVFARAADAKKTL